MSDISLTTAAERATYQEYDRQRRLNLTRGIAPAFAVLLAIFTIVLTIDAFFLPRVGSEFFNVDRLKTGLIVADSLLAACIAMCIAATLLARRGRVRWSTALIIVATNLTVITIEVAWAFGISGYDYTAVGTFASFIIAIVLAGVLGERWMIVATTALMNALTLSVILFAQAPHPAFEQDRSIAELAASQTVILAVGAPLVQWAIATIMLTTSGAYRTTLRELGDVRIAYERARQLDELKDQFISSVNHELRSPVMAMQGYLELLRLTEGTATPEKRKSLLDRATSASDNLAYLLGSILDARRMDLDAADFTPEVISVREAVGTAAQLIDPHEGRMIERELRVAIPANLHVWGEAVRVQQILTNLLSNAIKYSEPGSPVEVTAHLVTETDASHKTRRLEPRYFAEIAVRDYGLGVPPDQAPLLFQRFVRLPRDLASTTIGNGLGLYLCRVLAEAMQGSIRLESAGVAGQGTTFYLRLPLATEAAAQSPSRKTGPLSHRKTGPLAHAKSGPIKA